MTVHTDPVQLGMGQVNQSNDKASIGNRCDSDGDNLFSGDCKLDERAGKKTWAHVKTFWFENLCVINMM
jgi:hypothetical protein